LENKSIKSDKVRRNSRENEYGGFGPIPDSVGSPRTVMQPFTRTESMNYVAPPHGQRYGNTTFDVTQQNSNRVDSLIERHDFLREM